MCCNASDSNLKLLLCRCDSCVVVKRMCVCVCVIAYCAKYFLNLLSAAFNITLDNHYVFRVACA